MLLLLPPCCWCCANRCSLPAAAPATDPIDPWSIDHGSTVVAWSWAFKKDQIRVHIINILVLSITSLSGSLNQWFHLCILYSFLWCTPRFRTWPTLFHSLYNSSWLGDLKKFPQISFVRWWHLAVHLFHSYKFCSISWNTTTFNDILSWMNLNKLLLNPSKTEFLLIGTKQQRLKFSDLTNLSLSNDIIPVNSSASNLGFIFDSDMSFSDQINSVSKSCHFHIRDIRRIRHLLPLFTATALANSLVSSKLDYCNSLYSGISQSNLNKLQRIQNSLARVITNTSKYQHITPTLKKLHWLPIRQRIDYKICLLTYKTLTNQQPTYLYNSLSFPSHSVSTRSSDSLVLSIPYVRSSLGKRAFSVIDSRLWNSLPPDTRNTSSLPIFCSRLKTHLFKIAFPP